jgi:hypothetical protein
VGFRTLKEVKRRLDAYDPGGVKTIWMKNSEIGHYWMARKLSDITEENRCAGAGKCIRIQGKFPTANFTLRMDVPVKRIQLNNHDLREVRSRRDFRGGTFLVEGNDTYAAFELTTAGATLTI